MGGSGWFGRVLIEEGWGSCWGGMVGVVWLELHRSLEGLDVVVRGWVFGVDVWLMFGPG